MSGTPWTEEEKEIIKKYYPIEGKEIVKRLPNRTLKAIQIEASMLNTTHIYTIWTDEDISILKEYYPTEGLSVIKRFPNKTYTSVKSKATKLGLKSNFCKQNKYDLSGTYGIGYTTNTNEPFYFDLDKYDLIKNFIWHKNSHGYICSSKLSIMHRLIIGENNIPKGMCIDHINHKKYDNRLNNLRIVTLAENDMNRKRTHKTQSIYPGVRMIGNSYVASIGVNKKIIRLGTFKSSDEAIKAKIEAEKKYFGEFRNKDLDTILNKKIDLPQINTEKSDNKCKWSDKEKNILFNYYPLEGIEVIKRLPGRSIFSCYHQAKKLEIKYIRNNTEKYNQVDLFNEQEEIEN